jgi:hypothetical protein
MISELPMRRGLHHNRDQHRRRIRLKSKEEKEKHGLLKMEVLG